MARRTQPRAVAQRPAPDRDEDYLTWRYRWLGSMLAASEPGSAAAALAEEIAAKCERLHAAGKPIAHRLAQLERFIAELGLAAQAERFITARLNARARFTSPSDFAHRIERRHDLGGSKAWDLRPPGRGPARALAASASWRPPP